MRMLLIFALTMMIACTSTSRVQGGLINGDFETGDLTGWTTSAIDGVTGSIDPTPFIGVVASGGNSFVQFDTGEFDDGLFIATLEQTFTVEAAEPILRFDFSLPVQTADPTGSGTGLFTDALFVSLFDGVDQFDLLLVDAGGALADPFGTAPGTVTLGTASDPSFDFGLSADISSLTGSSVTLFFDLFSEDDGFVSVFDSDNVATGPVSPSTPVPEPSALVIWSLMGLGLVRCRRRRDGKG